MSERLRILVTDNTPESLHHYSHLVQRLGHETVGFAKTGTLLIERARQLEPDFIIAGAALPDRDGIEAIDAVCRERPVPAVMISEDYDEQLVIRSQNCCIMSYLAKPVTAAALGVAIVAAVKRFRQLHALRSEIARLRGWHSEASLSDCTFTEVTSGRPNVRDSTNFSYNNALIVQDSGISERRDEMIASAGGTPAMN